MRTALNDLDVANLVPEGCGGDRIFKSFRCWACFTIFTLWDEYHGLAAATVKLYAYENDGVRKYCKRAKCALT